MTQDIRAVLVILMQSTGNYTQRRITGQKDKDSYIAAMRQCIEIAKNLEFKDYTDLSINLLYSKHAGSMLGWRPFSRPRYYNQLAHDHAIEILEVLNKRFLTGHGDDGPRGWREWSTYKEDDAFN